MNCKNCHTDLTNDHNFCNSCGAKVIRNRLTLKNLFEHFSEQFLNYDNKLLQTFLDLFKRPENVIGSYIDGTRKKHVNVISYFAIAITISGLQLFFLSKYFPELLNMSAVSTPGTEEFNQNNLNFMQEYQSLFMMLNVPIYALISKLVFLKNKKYNYTEHLVIFMYILAQASIFQGFFILPSAFMGIDFVLVSMLLIPVQVLYSAYCLKRVFSLDMGQIILKTMLFLLIGLVLGVIVSIGTVFIMMQTGDFQEIMEAQKAARESAYTVSSAINWIS